MMTLLGMTLTSADFAGAFPTFFTSCKSSTLVQRPIVLYCALFYPKFLDIRLGISSGDGYGTSELDSSPSYSRKDWITGLVCGMM